MLFFLTGLKFHVDFISLLKHSQMKSDRRTVRTTVRTPAHMNTEGTLVTVSKKKNKMVNGEW